MSIITRSFLNNFKVGIDDFGSMSFGNYTDYGIFGTTGAQKDNRVSIETLADLAINDGLWFGIYSKIEQLIQTSGFRVYEVSKSGEYHTTKSSKDYESLLRENGIIDHISNMIVAGYGLGLGNGLGYAIKNNGKLEFKFEPFIMNNKHRVQVYTEGDLNNMEVTHYGILNDKQQEIYKFKADKVYHYKFSNPNGNPAFGINGVVPIAKWLHLKRVFLTANDETASNGMQARFLVSVDGKKIGEMGGSPEMKKQALEKLKADLSQGTGYRNSGKVLFTSVPLTFQDIQLNNSQQRVPEMLPYIDDQIYHSMGVDKAVLNIENSKYNNSEQAMDHLYQSLKSFIVSAQVYAESWLLPNLDPGYNNKKFVFRIPRQFSDEEIKIKEAKDRETQIYFSNLKSANESFGGYGVVVLPTEEKLATLMSDGYDFKTPSTEAISVEPSTVDNLADSFTGVTNSESVTRQIDQEEINTVYSKYHSIVNMSASELESWAENECSKNASLDRSPIDRNLKLLRTPKSQWGQNEVTQANRTISFVSRMKGAEQGQLTKTSDGKTCPSKRDISLKNWAYDPSKSRSINLYDTIKLKLDKSFMAVLES